MWNNSKRVINQGTPKGLNRPQFTAALNLIALAQSGKELSERSVSLAITGKMWTVNGDQPLPVPRIDDPTDQIR